MHYKTTTHMGNKTLFIEIIGEHLTLRMKGLSFKAIKEANDLKQDLCKSDISPNTFFIDCSYGKIDGKTAMPKLNYVVKILSELYDFIPFTKIAIKGHYEVTGEQLLKLVIGYISNK